MYYQPRVLGGDDNEVYNPEGVIWPNNLVDITKQWYQMIGQCYIYPLKRYIHTYCITLRYNASIYVYIYIYSTSTIQ